MADPDLGWQIQVNMLRKISLIAPVPTAGIKKSLDLSKVEKGCFATFFCLLLLLLWKGNSAWRAVFKINVLC
jgi:hypothetical protein